ncbi:ABATE domain-containing protein [Hasllibacter sp. MH4015]|uniref:CGNR zinc finger domain-containing protein n=1 Tax=Hasllibacter sp. MH4015 TaxID=2854029 RepID=UPI001CD64EAF|nr:ABATE domain-containing protein [Hasllibacter sp. MH4015]
MTKDQGTGSHVAGGDHPFLEFVNTVSDDGKTRAENTFQSPAELAARLTELGMLRQGARIGVEDMAALVDFREAAYRVLSAQAARKPPPAEAAATVEDALKSAVTHGQFVFRTKGLRITSAPRGTSLDRLALAMLDLLQSDDAARLSECRRCTRLFIDRGRGRGRRWCDMARCGNRAKAESFRARRRAARSG